MGNQRRLRRPTAGPCPRRRRWFNLIEVVLALGVIAFGLVSILALLPASIKSGRDSVGETHSSQGAENLIGLLANRMGDAESDAAWAEVALVLPTGKPGATEPAEGWVRWFEQDGITYWRAGDQQQFYRLDMRRAGSDTAEFTAVCRAWRQSVTLSEYDDGTWSSRTLPSSEAVALHVEIGWPAEIPYARRQKALYALNVFREIQ
ncbi:MAG: hypothetical protein JXR77_13005 [Lentisphaeria bacterium]|nr:hypothetical protein [Lentisphaeria bacterium]